MLFLKLLHVILVTTLFEKLSEAERKIIDGVKVGTPKRYMVYLTKTEKAEVIYDAWICGGAIVSPEFIVTSAACVEDVKFMYAVAGYLKYIKGGDSAKDPCIANSRKKIVYTCVPRSYEFAYNKPEKWAFIDIAVIKVESPYDFQARPLAGCSWTPDSIAINYHPLYQRAHLDAMVLGWGHTEKWRLPNDPIDHNQEELQYGSIRLEEKSLCLSAYNAVPAMHAVIDKYMICAMRDGNIKDDGKLKHKSQPNANGCSDNYVNINGACIDPRPPEPYRALLMPQYNPYGSLQSSPGAEQSQNYYKPPPQDDIVFDDVSFNVRRTPNNITELYNFTRRAGICQNDHGGPLVTWVGAREVLIGVSSVFRLTKSYECIGPFLFTSTFCNGAFLSCVIDGVGSNVDPHQNQPKNEECRLPLAQRGFDMIERKISWRSHPDGPAANELQEDLLERLQAPLQKN